jgi:hypothetical protein
VELLVYGAWLNGLAWLPDRYSLKKVMPVRAVEKSPTACSNA